MSNIEETLKNNDTTLIRQGDFILEKTTNSVPQDYKETNDGIIAHGESGNTHKAVGQVQIFENENEEMYVKNGAGLSQVVHEQHENLFLMPNTTYKKLPEQEFDYFERVVKKTLD